MIDRFQDDLSAIWRGEGKLGIAVSGGADSLALLLLAQGGFPGRVEAATVDHGLRPESAREAEHVAAICDRLHVPHATLPVTVEPGNIQANARTARYAALARWHDDRGLNALATAHHADDQAETLLMRLNRGSGLSGLAGVRAQSWFSSASLAGEYEVLRPLLGWRKPELEAVIERANITAVADPSNEDDAFDRVRVRKALAQQDWLDPLALARSAQLLGEAWRDVAREAGSQRDACVAEQDNGIILMRGPEGIYAAEIVRWIIAQLGGKASRSEIMRLIDRLEAGQNASLGGILARGIVYQTASGRSVPAWKFEPEPARKAGTR